MTRCVEILRGETGVLGSRHPSWDVTAYTLDDVNQACDEGGGDGAMKNRSKRFTAAQKVRIIEAVCTVLTAMVTTFGPVWLSGLP